MKQTDYTIKKDGERYTVYRNGKREAYGFNDKESALHSIWVIEGSQLGHIYYVNDEDVLLYLIEKEKDEKSNTM